MGSFLISPRELLLKFLRIKSYSRQEFTFAYFVAEIIEKLGFDVKFQFLGESSCNVIVNPKKSPRVAICTHLDTVPGEIPIRENGDKIYGRGSCDAKGQIVSAIWALMEVNELDNVSIVFVANEEEDGSGSLAYMNEFSPKNVVVLEPTSLKLANSSKGNLELLIEFHGEEKHGSIPSNTDAFSRFLVFLNDLKQKYEIRIISIHAGREDLYVTPSICRVLIDISTDNWEKTYYDVCKMISKYDAQFEIVDFSNSWKTEGKLVDVFSECMKKVGVNPIFETYPSWTDATRFVERGIPSIIFGPGDLAVAHTSQEYISFNEIKKAHDVLVEFIRRAEKETLDAQVKLFL